MTMVQKQATILYCVNCSSLKIIPKTTTVAAAITTTEKL